MEKSWVPWTIREIVLSLGSKTYVKWLDVGVEEAQEGQINIEPSGKLNHDSIHTVA